MIETRIDAKGFLSQLADEIVSDYTGSDKTITELVTELLAYQINSNPITLGTIEPTVTRSIEIQEDYLLNVLMTLRDTVGGYLSVDNDRKLNWLNSIGEDKGQQIRYNKNIKEIKRSMDFDNFGNRLYCYGAGEGTARIKLSQATGMTEDYVEDVASQGTYGVCIRKLSERSITHPDTLLAWANLKLEEMKVPHCTYAVDMVYLAALGWDFETLQLGSYVKVIDEELNIDINAQIVRFVRDLSNPINVKVEISNPGKDIVDTLSETYDDQQLQKSIAVKIGAGQVVVLGVFTVQDWLNAGTTTICGDNIRSGVIQSNNWDASHGSYYDLIAGTFKLGGSAAPKLSWDGVTLTISGAVYATSGEFTGTLKATTLSVDHILTINGQVNFGSGVSSLSPAGMTITGQYKNIYFKNGGVEYGYIYLGLSNNLGVEAVNILNLKGGTGVNISGGSGEAWIYGTAVRMSITGCLFLEVPKAASDPTAGLARIYFNTALGKFRIYDGSWRSL